MLRIESLINIKRVIRGSGFIFCNIQPELMSDVTAPCSEDLTFLSGLLTVNVNVVVAML